MWQMLLAGGLFIGTHLGISSSSLRASLVRMLGNGGYLALYSVLALVTLSYLIWLYGELPRYDYLWLPDPLLYQVARVIMPLAFVFLLGGFMVKNPTNVGAESLLRDADADGELARGVTRITRHPFQWGVAVWAVAHLIANGDVVSVIFFGTFAVLSLGGSVLIDAKKAAALDADWLPYRNQTSNLPFAAILAGRNRLVLSELWLPLVAGLATYAAALWGHQWLSGVRIV